MLGDRERSGAYTSEQRRLVRAAVAAEVLTFTPYWREAAAEVELRLPTKPADLQALPARPLTSLGPPDALLLRPGAEAVRKSGPRPLRRRLRRARLGRGRSSATRRILDPLYKPVHWIIEDELPVGCTEADLVRLAEIGQRSLELAGVTPNDAIVGLVPPGPLLCAWQLALGAREAGVPLAGLSPSTSLEAVALLGPTVLAGRPPDLLRVLRGLDPAVGASIVTVLALGRAPLQADERRSLEEAAGRQAGVVEAWAPPGVRALWTQCRGGDGVHTWPQTELLEVCGPDGAAVAPGEAGELVWTGLGWRGTVLVRLATGFRGRVVEGSCGTCGRTTARILDAAPTGSAGRRPTARAASVPISPAAAEVEAADEPGAVVGPVKETGGIESVRTLRSPRKERAGKRPAEGAKDESVDLGTAGVSADPADATWAAPHEDPEGVVRAVARDDDDPIVAGTRRATSPSAIGEVAHLPPVPHVGPDAGEGQDDRGSEAWFPDTGEVDAWPAPVLASIDGLASWQVEHRRRRGHDELVVHLALSEGAELGEVLVALERSIGATQYVVAGEADLEARLAAADGRRVVDRRARVRANGNGTRRPAATARPGSREG